VSPLCWSGIFHTAMSIAHKKEEGHQRSCIEGTVWPERPGEKGEPTTLFLYKPERAPPFTVGGDQLLCGQRPAKKPLGELRGGEEIKKGIQGTLLLLPEFPLSVREPVILLKVNRKVVTTKKRGY